MNNMCFVRTILFFSLALACSCQTNAFGLWNSAAKFHHIVNVKNQLLHQFLYGPAAGVRGYTGNRVYTAATDNSVSLDKKVKKRDVVLNIIQNNGYQGEKHSVTTQDGYRLKMHRIPYTNDTVNLVNRKVAFVMHGIICSSADWVNTGKNTGIGYTLADAGFDVWMGNARGNAYSKKHNYLEPNSKEYWDFSWNEIGYYDLPAMIDYILALTNQQQLYFVGHSQGTTSLFVLLSTRPEYNQKISTAFLLSPVAFLENVPNPVFRLLGLNYGQLENVFKQFRIYEILQKSELVRSIGNQFCNDMSPVQEACAQFIFFLVGYSMNQLNRTLLPTILTHIPAGISTKQLYHFGQSITTGKFSMYDHKQANFEIYGSVTPPEYNLANIQIPLAFYMASNDLIVSNTDFDTLQSKLTNAKIIKKNTLAGFNHMDFLFGIDVKRLVYDDIVRTINAYF